MAEQSKGLSAKLTGIASFEMGSAEPLVTSIIADIKTRGASPRALFSALPRGYFKYAPTGTVLSREEHHAVVSFFDLEADANGT